MPASPNIYLQILRKKKAALSDSPKFKTDLFFYQATFFIAFVISKSPLLALPAAKVMT